jgi:hypothetical protein
MAVGTIPIEKCGLTPITKSTSNASWPPAAAAAERRRREPNLDEDDWPPRLRNRHAATIRAAAQGLRSVGHPQADQLADSAEPMLDGEDDVEKSLRQLHTPATREVVEKANAPLRGHIRKLEGRLGRLHLAKFEGSSAYGDPHARAQIEQIRKVEGGTSRG